MRRFCLTSIVGLGLSIGFGCSSHRAPQVATTLPVDTNLSSPTTNADVSAVVDPPLGWHTDALKKTGRHAHQVWISPTGSTAYGVIHFNLPLPVGSDLVLWGFLNEMKRSEGESTLISKQRDESIGAMRFVAEGGQYRIRANLFVDGFAGWAIYAGTLRARPIDADELLEAEHARDATHIGETSPATRPSH